MTPSPELLESVPEERLSSLRIVVVQGPYFPVPPLLNSGVEKMWYGLAREFRRRGCSVTQISRRFCDLPEKGLDAGVQHVRLPSRDAPRSAAFYRAYDAIYSFRALRALPEDANIVITNCTWLPLLMRGRQARRLYVHVARYPKGQMRLYRHAARLQAVSTAVSKAIEREIPELTDRIVAIPPYTTNAEGGAGLGEPTERREKLVLYLGRIHPEKGVHLLLDAFIRFAPSDWNLQISGSHETRQGGGGEAYLARLKLAASREPSRIAFTGSVPAAELNRQYRLAALLVYPSLAEFGESFGVVPLEAMACGCPAVVSDLACFRDYLIPGHNGYVFNHRSADPAESLGRELRSALADPVGRSRIAEAGIRTSRHYSLQSVATLYLPDFFRVIRRGPA